MDSEAGEVFTEVAEVETGSELTETKATTRAKEAISLTEAEDGGLGRGTFGGDAVEARADEVMERTRSKFPAKRMAVKMVYHVVEVVVVPSAVVEEASEVPANTGAEEVLEAATEVDFAEDEEVVAVHREDVEVSVAVAGVEVADQEVLPNKMEKLNNDLRLAARG